METHPLRARVAVVVEAVGTQAANGQCRLLLIAVDQSSRKLIKYSKLTDLSRLHLSILQNLGIPLDRFGDAKTPLAEFV